MCSRWDLNPCKRCVGIGVLQPPSAVCGKSNYFEKHALSGSIQDGGKPNL